MNNRGYKTVLLSSWKYSARIAVALLLSSVLMSPVHAETVYVTDMLQLDLYATKDMSGRPKRKLRSGDRMEVLERDSRYARVKLGDGESGWVKSL